MSSSHSGGDGRGPGAFEEPEEPEERDRGSAPLPPADAIRSEALLRGKSEVRILHREDVYRLILTRSGKLLLQK